MPETGNNLIKRKLSIRISAEGLSFSVFDPMISDPLIHESYTLKSNISVATNMREAFRSVPLLQNSFQRVQVIIDTEVLMVPLERFTEDDVDILYHHSFPKMEGRNVLYSVIPDLNVVALFSINKDLKIVLDEHFPNITYLPVNIQVWRHLHERSFTGTHNKLFGYFHNKKIEIFCFNQNRFKFCNTFRAVHHFDATYFLLFVWKTLALNPEKDELHLVGDIPEREELTKKLHEYLRNVYIINPSADFNRSVVTQVPGMPYDLQTLLTSGK